MQLRRYGILLLLLAAAPVFADEAWVSFRDPAGLFTVDFPGTPLIQKYETPTGTGSKIPTAEYAVEQGQLEFVVMVGDFSHEKIDAATSIANAMRGITGNGRTLKSNEVEVLDGARGHNTALVNRDGQLLTDRIFFIDGSMYQAITALPPGATSAQKAEAARFNHSFHFVRK